MNKLTKKILCIISIIMVAILMQAILGSKQVRAEVKSGESKGMKWSLDTDTGVFSISGGVDTSLWFLEENKIDKKAIKTLKVAKDIDYFSVYITECPNLTTVELENEKTTCKSQALIHCDNLETVKHGNNFVEKYDKKTKTLTISGKGAFNSSFISYAGCIEFDNLKIEEGITKLETKEGEFSSLFSNNTIENVSLPSSLTLIDNNAFSGNGKLESIELPSKLEQIGNNAFSSCLKLKKITIPNSVKEIGSGCFKDCKALEEVEFSTNLKKIPSNCFEGCESLKELTIPKYIEEIELDFFKDCENLSKLNIENGNIKTTGGAYYQPVPNLKELKIGEIEYKFDRDNGILEISGSKKITNTHSVIYIFGEQNVKTIKINEGVEELDNDCFDYYLSGVEKIELPNSLKIIGSNCFNGAKKLKEIELSKNIEKIGRHSFDYCEELTIKTEEGSVAYEYAKDNDIDVEVVKTSTLKSISGAMIGIIIGCAVAGILFIVLIVVIIIVVVKSKKKKQTT